MSQELERVYTINLGKVLLTRDNQRAKRAINMIREFAQHHMKTDQIKIEEDLSHQIWQRGIKHPPRKIRVKMTKSDEGFVLISPYEEEMKEAVSPEKEKEMEQKIKPEEEIEPKSEKETEEEDISKETKKPKKEIKKKKETPQKISLKITSEDFVDKGKISQEFTCDGENISPPLTFSGIPSQSKSLALIMDDPDAPKGTFVHWVVWNIAPDKTSLEKGEKIKAMIGKNDFGKAKYGGPCPPSGIHKYFFKLYALDSLLDLSKGSTKKELEKAMTGHIIEQASLVGKYSRISSKKAKAEK